MPSCGVQQKKRPVKLTSILSLQEEVQESMHKSQCSLKSDIFTQRERKEFCLSKQGIFDFSCDTDLQKFRMKTVHLLALSHYSYFHFYSA